MSNLTVVLVKKAFAIGAKSTLVIHSLIQNGFRTGSGLQVMPFRIRRGHPESGQTIRFSLCFWHMLHKPTSFSQRRFSIIVIASSMAGSFPENSVFNEVASSLA
ncbi:hypothetical protein BH11VER1_BH11VER1_30840 [soil metagenome]